MSQYVLLRIQAIQEELEALKKTVIHQLKGSRNKTQIRGLWKDVIVSDEDLEVAETAVTKLEYNSF